jgi:RNA polymerase sigma factor (sigma-70 family)
MKRKSDAELIRLVMDKQRIALEELYDRYARLVYSFALKSTKEEQRARVIVQAVFTRLWITERGYDESKGKFVNWLLTITRNCVIDESRRERKHLDPIQLSEEGWSYIEDPLEENNPEAVFLQKEKKEQVRKAFQWLSDPQVQLLQWIYWEGYSLSEIAEKTKVPLGTIKSRLHQTLKRLRQHIVTEGEG